MKYNIVVKEEAKDDLKSFAKSQQLLIMKQFKKIASSPELGQPLGNKSGYGLRGCRKMYVDKKRIRIVYKIVDNQIIVEVIAIGKRDEMQVYKDASLRL